MIEMEDDIAKNSETALTTGFSTRRNFLHLIMAGLGGVTAAAVAYPLIRYLSPMKGKGENADSVVFNESDVAPGEAKIFTFKGDPAAIINVGNTFAVYNIACTHLGCLVKWQTEKKEFLCPCHAGRFGSDGKVLGGPPPAPLKSLPFKVSAGKITVGGQEG